MAILVIYLPGRDIRKNFIGLCDFQELLLVACGLVRVVFLREFAIGCFQVTLRTLFVETQDFIEIFGGEGADDEGEKQ